MTRRFHSAIKINIFCEILIFTARCRVQPVAASDDSTGGVKCEEGGAATRAGPRRLCPGPPLLPKNHH